MRYIYWWLLQFGIDPRRTWRALVELPRFVADYWRFRRAFTGAMSVLPSMHDRRESAGSVENEYFGQDLHVAQCVFRHGPRRHIDVGSRFDGFVAHVASYRKIEVIDIRPVVTQVPNVTFIRGDLMSGIDGMDDSCDSLSCLHAIEHFGLGRYGDGLQPDGHIRGIRNLARMVQPGGRLYLSCPVGIDRVEYNSHRILDPVGLLATARDCGLDAEGLATVSRKGVLSEAGDVARSAVMLSRSNYSLAIFTFRKRA